MNNANTRHLKRLRRKSRVRAKVQGTAERPRLSVHRSLTTINAQLIDDQTGKTIVAVNSKNVKAADAGERTGKTALAYTVGKMIAEQAQQKNITSIVFDRGGFAYHGRVQAVADGARDGGLQF